MPLLSEIIKDIAAGATFGKASKRILSDLLSKNPLLPGLVDVSPTRTGFTFRIDISRPIELVASIAGNEPAEKSALTIKQSLMDMAHVVGGHLMPTGNEFYFSVDIDGWIISIGCDAMDEQQAGVVRSREILLDISYHLIKLYGEGVPGKALGERVPFLKNLPAQYNTKHFRYSLPQLAGVGVGMVWRGKIDPDDLATIEKLGALYKVQAERHNFVDERSMREFFKSSTMGMDEDSAAAYRANPIDYNLQGDLLFWMRLAYREDFEEINNRLQPLVTDKWGITGSLDEVNDRLSKILHSYVPRGREAATKKCLYCGKEFPSTRKNRLFCSHKCRVYYNRQRKGQKA